MSTAVLRYDTRVLLLRILRDILRVEKHRAAGQNHSKKH